MPASGSSSLPLQPKSIAHLPKELLHLVTSSLNLTSAQSLLTTSKLLSEPAEARIWSEVELSLPHHHGEHPLIRPHPHGTTLYWDWAKGEAKAAEYRGRDDLDARVKEILLSLNKRRLGYVKGLQIMARAGSATSSAAFLALVGPRLESLTIVPPLKHIWDANWQPEYHETLYSKLHVLGSSSAFRLPALRSLDVTLSQGIEYNDSILLLLEAAAPSLEELRLDVGSGMEALDEETNRTGPRRVDGRYYPHVILPKVRVLALVCQGTIDYALELALINTGKLRSVTLHGACKAHEDIDEGDLSVHLAYSDIRELEWTQRHLTGFIKECIELEDSTEDPLYRGINSAVLEDQLSSAAPCIEFTPIPPFYNLETLLVKVPSWKPRVSDSEPPPAKCPFNIELNDYRTIPAPLAQWLRDMARSLQVIQYFPSEQQPVLVDLTDWDRNDCHGAIIRSFCPDPSLADESDEDTVVHVRSRTQWLTEAAFCATYPSETRRSRVLTYATSLETDWSSMLSIDAEMPTTTYVRSPDCHWTDMTDYRGLVVPPEVMLRMIRAAGLTSPDKQQGRRIEVDAKGWKVLQDWYKEQEEAKATKVVEEEVEETVDNVPNSQDSAW